MDYRRDDKKFVEKKKSFLICSFLSYINRGEKKVK